MNLLQKSVNKDLFSEELCLEKNTEKNWSTCVNSSIFSEELCLEKNTFMNDYDMNINPIKKFIILGLNIEKYEDEKITVHEITKKDINNNFLRKSYDYSFRLFNKNILYIKNIETGNIKQVIFYITEEPSTRKRRSIEYFAEMDIEDIDEDIVLRKITHIPKKTIYTNNIELEEEHDFSFTGYIDNDNLKSICVFNYSFYGGNNTYPCGYFDINIDLFNQKK